MRLWRSMSFILSYKAIHCLHWMRHNGIYVSSIISIFLQLCIIFLKNDYKNNFSFCFLLFFGQKNKPAAVSHYEKQLQVYLCWRNQAQIMASKRPDRWLHPNRCRSQWPHKDHGFSCSSGHRSNRNRSRKPHHPHKAPADATGSSPYRFG